MSFEKPDVVAESAANVPFDTSEVDVLVVTDLKYFKDTQYSIFYDYALGTNTSMKIRYYVQNEVGGSWYELPVKVEATSVLTTLPTTINSDSPASRVVEERPVPACFGFKITAQGVGGAGSTLTAKVLQRTN